MLRPLFLIAFLLALPLNVFGRGIQNIKTFLDQCPTNDPAFSEIMLDFEIRREGKSTTVPFCSEPVSAMRPGEYTDELIALQTLRVMYYMDRGMRGHLPWTSTTLYDWMKTKVGGINIVAGAVTACCETIDGKTFFTVGSRGDLDRETYKLWLAIAGNIALYAHEARHVDGFGHTDCCGVVSGCDDAFDVANLSAFGVQWWLFSLFLNGTINVGYACMPAAEAAETTSLLLTAANDVASHRFCTTRPALLSESETPGGLCATTSRRRAVRR